MTKIQKMRVDLKKWLDGYGDQEQYLEIIAEEFLDDHAQYEDLSVDDVMDAINLICDEE